MVVPGTHLSAVRDHFRATLTQNLDEVVRPKNAPSVGHDKGSLSPDTNVYSLALRMGLQIYDTSPLYVFHNSSFSSTWGIMREAIHR